MGNLELYEKVRSCPEEAKKTIQAGKLKGKSDINPMWRIKKLTEVFGACGTGWKTYDEHYWTTDGAKGEVIAWCSIKLTYKQNGEWSEPVSGIGGSMLIDTQKGTLTSNDEAFKMAYTDAISVACKMLGVAADVYWAQDNTKYSKQEATQEEEFFCEECGARIGSYKGKQGKMVSPAQHAKASRGQFDKVLCLNCINKAMGNE